MQKFYFVVIFFVGVLSVLSRAYDFRIMNKRCVSKHNNLNRCHNLFQPHGSRLYIQQSQQSPDRFELKGEDLVPFRFDNQDGNKWREFFIAVGGVLTSLAYIWGVPGGPELGNKYVDWIESISNGDSTVSITYMLLVFAIIHSGLASLRPKGEEIIGAKAWRYVFAYPSLALAFTSIVYFINHRYDGIQLWDLRLAPGMHDFVWWSSLISFFFLYPSTFNLLEIAAVDKPQLHLWETGITRITRHPQMVGQLIWCIAHTAYIGTSFMCATSSILCAHHLFAVWNGDRRLRDKWGDRFDAVKDRTSIIPFAAIATGKQVLPDDYYKELIIVPYLAVLLGSAAAYYAHPFMQAGATLVGY